MEILALYKQMLGITHTITDERLEVELSATEEELNRKGCNINTDDIDDMLLVVDYATWEHQHRIDGQPLPNNILLRIRNRIIRARSELDE